MSAIPALRVRSFSGLKSAVQGMSVLKQGESHKAAWQARVTGAPHRHGRLLASKLSRAGLMGYSSQDPTDQYPFVQV